MAPQGGNTHLAGRLYDHFRHRARLLASHIIKVSSYEGAFLRTMTLHTTASEKTKRRYICGFECHFDSSTY